MVDALVAAGHALAEQPGADRPGIVHRLDRDVSGLLVVAKTDEAHQELSKAMRRRAVERLYLALVHGAPSVDRGKIDAPIGRDPRHRTRMTVLPEGRASVTWFTVLERLEDAALLEVRLETGRTHQIRTHLASIGHPIVGDAAYGRDPGFARTLGLRRPFLHAYRLSFDHPVTGERVDVTSTLPDDLQRALDTVRT
jgi:23S rRNA pseudouridine1911/1915/1917 synthase